MIFLYFDKVERWDINNKVKCKFNFCSQKKRLLKEIRDFWLGKNLGGWFDMRGILW